jgi:glutathionylspermidine synthase
VEWLFLRTQAEKNMRVRIKTKKKIRKPVKSRHGRGAKIVAHLKGRGDVPMSTDEILTLTRG